MFALFVATALSISAIPVLAKILMDLDLMRREFGQTVLAAGMIDDITGWTMLGVVTALASAEAITAGSVVLTFAMVAIFILVTMTVGRFVVERGLGLIQDRFRGRDAILTLVVVLAFAWGAFSQALRLEPVIGAFAIGIFSAGSLGCLPTSFTSWRAWPSPSSLRSSSRWRASRWTSAPSFSPTSSLLPRW